MWRGLRCLTALAVLAAASPALFAVTSVAVYPQNYISFGFSPVNTTSATSITETVYNTGATSVTLSSVTVTPSQFQLTGGTTPVTIAAGGFANFTLSFTPDTARSYTGTLTFNFTGLPSQKVTLNGVGINGAATATLNTTAINFGNQALGTTGSQSLTITNNGSSSYNLTGVTVTYPFWQTGFTGTSTRISPGATLTLQINYFPTQLVTNNGGVLLTFNTLPNAGVSLTGTGIAPSALAVSTFPTLPAVTQSAAYSATLTASGGAGALSWSLASGSSLPQGLTLSSSGIISGTPGSSVAVGNYAFTAQVTDSSNPPVTATEAFTLPVAGPTGAACNFITWNDKIKNTPLVAINDLGTNFYKTYQGGLYGGGSNVDPSDHDSFGVSLAQGIQPLDAAGNPSPTGKYVFLSIGHSNTQGAFSNFVPLAMADPARNPSLVVVNGATGNASADVLQDPTSYFWTVITNNYLPNAGVTPNQVVAAWVNDVTSSHPPSIALLQTQLESILRNLQTKFPNIKIAYMSSINYTGYAYGVKGGQPEPTAYEAGFATRLTIQDQLNGVNNLNFDPAKGAVVAPWLVWGPYYWTNGLLPRSDGLVWTCQDSISDGTHPSDPVGRTKIDGQLLNFLRSDGTASIWYLAPPAHR